MRKRGSLEARIERLEKKLAPDDGPIFVAGDFTLVDEADADAPPGIILNALPPGTRIVSEEEALEIERERKRRRALRRPAGEKK